MSYDIDIIATDPVERSREDFSPTYNYAAIYRRLWTDGIRSLDGMTCADAVIELRRGIKILSETPTEKDESLENQWLDEGERAFKRDPRVRHVDYGREQNRSWAPSDRNAATALKMILEGCERWPHGKLKVL